MISPEARIVETFYNKKNDTSFLSSPISFIDTITLSLVYKFNKNGREKGVLKCLYDKIFLF